MLVLFIWKQRRNNTAMKAKKIWKNVPILKQFFLNRGKALPPPQKKIICSSLWAVLGIRDILVGIRPMEL